MFAVIQLMRLLFPSASTWPNGTILSKSKESAHRFSQIKSAFEVSFYTPIKGSPARGTIQSLI